MKKLFGCCLFIVSTILCTCFHAHASEKLIWKDKFAGSKTMEEAGFRKTRTLNGDEFKLNNGILTMTFREWKPYKGTSYQLPLPAVPRGVFTFEVKLASAGAKAFNNASLIVGLGPHRTFFRNNYWVIHRPKHGDMLPYMPVKLNQWTKYKIVFDADNRMAEYYINDMKKPYMVDIDSEANKKPLSLTIANYALTKGAVTHQIRNMKLVQLPPEQKEMSGLIRFHGVSFYPESFVKSFGEKEIINCNMDFHRANFKVQNRIKMTPVRIPWTGIPKYMIMENMPASIFTKFDQRSMIHAVKSGSHLIILGGLYTLNKGEFSKSLLKNILPVAVQNVWAVKRFDKPLTTSFGPVFHIHDLKLLPGAEVLMSANGTVPLLVRKKIGKGSVIVFLGIEPGRGIWDYQNLSKEIKKHIK